MCDNFARQLLRNSEEASAIEPSQKFTSDFHKGNSILQQRQVEMFFSFLQLDLIVERNVWKCLIRM